MAWKPFRSPMMVPQGAPSLSYRQPAPPGVRPGAQVPKTRGYRMYSKLSGQVSTSSTVTVTLTFPVTTDLYGMSLGVDINNTALQVGTTPLDLFESQVSFQTGDQLITASTQAAAIVEENTGKMWFITPYQVPGGQSLQLQTKNLSSSITLVNVYYVFFGVELEVANPNI